MNNITYKKDLLGVQDDLLRFAYKLTSDREEANDLLQADGFKTHFRGKTINWQFLGAIW